MPGHQTDIKNKQKICGTSSNIVVIRDYSISYKDKATGSPIVVTLGQEYNVGEKPTFILYTSINRHAEPPNRRHYSKRVVVIYDKSAIEPYQTRGLGQQ